MEMERVKQRKKRKSEIEIEKVKQKKKRLT